ncbi:MAG TPA: hypothetical protein VFE91_03175, partial [Nitrososphaerales archaeon]|nr:hypothetical protein [Nitrososphaerales archaeon]
MKFREFEQEVEATLSAAVASAGFPVTGLDLSVPPSEEYGDLSSSVPIRIAKATNRKPAEVAVS